MYFKLTLLFSPLWHSFFLTHFSLPFSPLFLIWSIVFTVEADHCPSMMSEFSGPGTLRRLDSFLLRVFSEISLSISGDWSVMKNVWHNQRERETTVVVCRRLFNCAYLTVPGEKVKIQEGEKVFVLLGPHWEKRDFRYAKGATQCNGQLLSWNGNVWKKLSGEGQFLNSKGGSGPGAGKEN